MLSDELIRSALFAEADRAPSDIRPEDLLSEVGPRRGVGRRLGVMIPAAAAVVAVAAGIPVVVGHLAGDRQVRSAGSAPANCPSQVHPVTAGAPLSFPVCYLPTKLPAGWVGWSREVNQGVDSTGKALPTVLSWEKPGHGSQRGEYMYLTIGAAADFAPEGFVVDGEVSIVPAPTPYGSFASTKQVGPDHQVDINGVTGTRRMVQAIENTRHRLIGTVDAITWSPAPGVVLTLHITGATGAQDEVDTLLAVARSVAPSTDTVTLPFQVPALPDGATLATETILGTSPRNWEAIAEFNRPGSENSFLMSWGPDYGNHRMPNNATARGEGAFFEHAGGGGDISLPVHGSTLVVQGPANKTELGQIADGMTFQPDAEFPWLGR
ncbi:MAG TPA: hypothetical protein VFX16_00680 [Pseudonocardiaceae bacterium]|nr:hypothetical protein [Pseudonocardiaceae bacterium]